MVIEKEKKLTMSIAMVLVSLGIIITVSAVGYLSLSKYHTYQVAQEKSLEEAKKEIENLKMNAEEEKKLTAENNKKINELGTKQKNVQVSVKDNLDNQSAVNNSIITSSDLNPYISGVAEIICHGENESSGTGSLWLFGNLGFTVLTNRHVITSANCDLAVDSVGIYNLDPIIYSWNRKTDVAVLKIADDAIEGNISAPKSNLNYATSELRHCPSPMQLNSPVTVIGFPAFTVGQNKYGQQSAKTITNGIISAYDSTKKKPIGDLTFVNYFISAKIDSGNSGGVVFSKDEKGLCVLGLPTWISIGNYETQGLVQNIQNVMEGSLGL